MKKILILLLLSVSLFGQNKDPYKILDAVKEKFNNVKDYEVDATITVDVNFLRVPESKAKIYFKQPDKLKLDSEGFALLPKEGINFSPAKLLSGDFNAIFIKSDTLKSKNVDVVKVIPSSDSADVILTTLWIDQQMSVVRKMETTTKRNGTFEINLSYEKSNYKFLPSEVRLKFSVNEMQIPKTITGEFNNNEENGRKEKNEPMSGMVIVKYSNYKINQGLKDSLFEKKKR
ncbi:MAG: hypothetical protein A2068_00650 [Ignavibacteria bacterium GWB2_35_6b]|nr:MAG: hypothetical protein A2068_00650 [Ignavibacteria bacterium GWB2_35_6b]